MVSHDASILRKRKEKNLAKNTDSQNDDAVPSEEERTYGIDRLNIGEPGNDSKNDFKSENESKHADDPLNESKLLLAQLREVHMANKKDINNSTKRECKILSNFLTLQTRKI